ncbi:MAG TPA: hypothetical protein P5514_08470 [Bacteroidales bacterium]|nr:hypothetical protein [Bacteroidales bacterium]HPE55863.1 hypothetical protein [Bacteroidales bacterium]HRX96963.1 hypothetical protein [Bacteroidales bacterium]
MDKTILNIFKGVMLVLIALAVILQILVLIKGEEGLVGSSVLDNYAYLAYVAIILTTFLAILFPVMFMIQNPKNALKILAGIAGLVVLGFICYSIADNTFNVVRLEELKTTKEVSRLVGGALYFTYIVGGIAVVSIIFSGIAGLFK